MFVIFIRIDLTRIFDRLSFWRRAHSLTADSCTQTNRIWYFIGVNALCRVYFFIYFFRSFQFRVFFLRASSFPFDSSQLKIHKSMGKPSDFRFESKRLFLIKNETIDFYSVRKCWSKWAAASRRMSFGRANGSSVHSFLHLHNFKVSEQKTRIEANGEEHMKKITRLALITISVRCASTRECV